MLIEDISATQILTAILFIVILVIAQLYVTKNKNRIKGKWIPNRRIVLIENTRLGPNEKAQIIKVDSTEYLYFLSKGTQPVIFPITTNDKKIQNKKIGNQPHSKPISTSNQIANKSAPNGNVNIKGDKKIIQAISAARKQNPKVSFK
mgnify:CR=1 FL=1